MRRVSLNARQSHDALSSSSVEVVLLMIEHQLLSEPLRLSTDPTERLSLDPLEYGTRSGWRGANPVTEPFKFILASAEVPSDLEEAPARARIVVENLHHGIAGILRSFTDRAVVHVAVVLAETPNIVELQYEGLEMTSVDGTLDEFVISLGRPTLEDESVPMDRITPERFPGLFR